MEMERSYEWMMNFFHYDIYELEGFISNCKIIGKNDIRRMAFEFICEKDMEVVNFKLGSLSWGTSLIIGGPHGLKYPETSSHNLHEDVSHT